MDLQMRDREGELGFRRSLKGSTPGIRRGEVGRVMEGPWMYHSRGYGVGFHANAKSTACRQGLTGLSTSFGTWPCLQPRPAMTHRLEADMP